MQNYVGLVVIGLLILTGCSESKEVVHDGKGSVKREGVYVRALELPQDGVMTETAQRELKVVVEPFTDRRSERNRLGNLTSIFGSKTPIYAVDADLGQMMTLLVIDALKRHKGWDVWLDRPGVVVPEGGPDVRLKGEILECEVNAESLLVGTNIKAGVRVMVQARNAEDGSTAEMLIEQGGQDWKFWFDPEDAEAQFNGTLHHGLAQLVSRTAMSHRVLRFTPDENSDHKAVDVQDRKISSVSNKKGTP